MASRPRRSSLEVNRHRDVAFPHRAFSGWQQPETRPFNCLPAAMSTAPARLIAFGDVHGCLLALETLLEVISPTPEDTLVFLGDLIDNGRDSAGVIDRLIGLHNECQVRVIRGNHEEMLLEARHSEPALRSWEDCGGVRTLNSYRFGGNLRDIPAPHWSFLEHLLPYVETDKFLFTHASYDPNLPLSDHPGHLLRWTLFDPEELRPHVSGKCVVVGHTENRNHEILDLGFALNLDTACHRDGWLTACEVRTRHCWQASRWGMLREPGEKSLSCQFPAIDPAVT